MLERWELISKDPYTEAAEIIEQWAKKNYYDDFVVTLRLEGEIVTTLLCMDEAANMEWANDWWEGQKEVRMIGFVPLSDLLCIGEPIKGNRNFVLALSAEELRGIEKKLSSRGHKSMLC